MVLYDMTGLIWSYVFAVAGALSRETRPSSSTGYSMPWGRTRPAARGMANKKHTQSISTSSTTTTSSLSSPPHPVETMQEHVSACAKNV